MTPPNEDADREGMEKDLLRERLIIAAFTGLAANPNFCQPNHPLGDSHQQQFIAFAAIDFAERMMERMTAR